MPFARARFSNLHDFAQSEVSKDIERRIWREQPDFWGEVIPAAFAMENTVGSVRERMKFPLSGSPPNPNFDAFDPGLNQGTVFEQYPELLTDIHNFEDWRVAKERAENELSNMRMLESSGGMATGALLLAGLFDPINLLPVGVSAPRMMSSALRGGFATGMKRIGRGASAGLFGNIQAEAVLYPTQHFRTPEQTGVSIAAGTLFGAIVGTTSIIPHALRDRAIRELQREFGQPLPRQKPLDAEPIVSVKEDLRETAPESQSSFEHTAAVAERDSLIEQARQVPKKLQREIKELEAKIELEKQVDAARVTRPVSVDSILAAKDETLLDPARPMTTIDAASKRKIAWGQSRETLAGDLPHFTTIIPLSALRQMVSYGRVKVSGLLPQEKADLDLQRPRLHVSVSNPSRATKHVKAELQIENAGKLPLILDMLEYRDMAGSDIDVPVEIVIVGASAERLPLDLKIARDLSLGRLGSHISAQSITSFDLLRSIVCASPCRIITNEDIFESGHTVPGGYHEDGSVGISARALELDTTGAYNPDTEATESEIVSALGFEKLVGSWFPAVRLATSPNLRSRQLVQKLIDTTLRYENHALGVPGPRSAQSGIRMWNRQLGELLTRQNEEWINHRIDVSGGSRRKNLALDVAITDTKDVFQRGAPEGAWTKHEFMEEIGQAMRRQLNGEPGSDNPRVEAAAQATRKVIESLYEAAEKVGIVEPIKRTDAEGNPTTRTFAPSGRATSDSHFRRVWKRRLLSQEKEQAAFVDAVVNDWMTAYPNRSLAEATDDAMAVLDNILGTPVGRATPGGIREIPPFGKFVRKISAKLEGKSDALDELLEKVKTKTEEGVPILDELFAKTEIHPDKTPSALRPRTLDVPDSVIERWLESNVQHVTRQLFRTLTPDIEIARNFGYLDPETGLWHGDPNMKLALLELQFDLAEQGRIRRERGDPEQSVVEYESRVTKDIEDLANLRDLMRGYYALPNNPDHSAYKISTGIRMVNYLTMGGGFMLSSIADLSRIVTVNGFHNTFNSALSVLSLPKGIRQQLGYEGNLAGVAFEVLLNQRTQNIFDLEDDFGRLGRVNLGLRAAADRFAVLSGLSPWTDLSKRWAAIVSSQELLKNVIDWASGKATPRQIEMIAAWGLDYKMAKAIASEVGDLPRHKGLIVFNSRDWKNREARDAFRLGLGKAVESQIITPGPGDIPLLMHQELFRGLLQFKRFGVASTKSALLSNLQYRDRAVLNGAMVAIGLGAVVTQFKAEQYGYSINDPREFLLSAIDRSGLLGLFPDINKSIGEASRGMLAPGQLIFGGHNKYPYTNTDASDALLGPTRGTIRNITKASHGIAKLVSGQGDQAMESEFRAMAKLSTPYSLFYLTRTLDKLVMAAAKPGLDARRRERKRLRELGEAPQAPERPLHEQHKRVIDRGDYTLLEMEFEDHGVPGLLDLTKERYELATGKRLPLDREARAKLATRFTTEKLALLKQASDENGITGMVDFLKATSRLA